MQVIQTKVSPLGQGHVICSSSSLVVTLGVLFFCCSDGAVSANFSFLELTRNCSEKKGVSCAVSLNLVLWFLRPGGTCSHVFELCQIVKNKHFVLSLAAQNQTKPPPQTQTKPPRAKIKKKKPKPHN